MEDKELLPLQLIVSIEAEMVTYCWELIVVFNESSIYIHWHPKQLQPSSLSSQAHESYSLRAKARVLHTFFMSSAVVE